MLIFIKFFYEYYKILKFKNRKKYFWKITICIKILMLFNMYKNINVIQYV